MACRGICYRYKVHTNQGYITGAKRCSPNTCDCFIMWDGAFCPCCGIRLRLSPRRGYDKKRVKDANRPQRETICLVSAFR